MDEFELIARYLAPLAGEGAFGLKDDAAFHHGAVITKDLLVDGVHFRTDDGWASAARKCLRANISDIVAKGAAPDGVFLGFVWPSDVKEVEIADFCDGLSADMTAYGLSLLGGDTTRHRLAGAPLTVSITMTGQPGPRGMVRRDGAKPGDALLVTGTIGDGWLGLEALLNGWTDYSGAIDAYLAPQPPAPIAPAIAQWASAAIDISDGLLADAGHLAKASGVRLKIEGDQLPWSEDAARWIKGGGERGQLVTGGDDYQTLLTVPSDNVRQLMEEAEAANCRLTVIGGAVEGEPAAFIHAADWQVLGRGGFSHF
ncbi:thiamine-phosphate kinase [Parvularcula marina]|uniref:Thiamine-monophosphate kinase n=1 Tax=Parvularcula marina TaxID=2292771 RepID=A0A371RL60_9PROT|nr:thiamine-phosphate kinase [Parvularcula marina]RFB06202.1 thiamine-phosphate kinase [Parvularcula marina]